MHDAGLQDYSPMISSGNLAELHVNYQRLKSLACNSFLGWAKALQQRATIGWLTSEFPSLTERTFASVLRRRGSPILQRSLTGYASRMHLLAMPSCRTSPDSIPHQSGLLNSTKPVHLFKAAAIPPTAEARGLPYANIVKFSFAHSGKDGGSFPVN